MIKEKSRKLMVLSVFCFFLLTSIGIKSLCSQRNSEELELVVKAYEYQSSVVKNMIIEGKVYYKSLSSIGEDREKSRFKLIRERDKKLVKESSGIEGAYFTKVFYDKKSGKVTEYSEFPSSHGISRNGIIDFLDDRYERFRFQDIVGEIRIGDKRLLDLLQHENANVSSTHENLNGTFCWVVEGYYKGNPKLEYKVWVDPEIGFMPRFVKIGRQKMFSFEMKFVNYKEIYPKVWFPINLETKFMSPTSQTMKLSSKDTITVPATTYSAYIVTSAKVNSGLPSETFKMTFPSGTEVNDRIAGIYYTIP